MDNLKVVLIGGAGYVGQVVCSFLKDKGVDVHAVSRGSTGFILERAGAKLLSPDQLPAAGSFDAVINLAYPTKGPIYGRYHQNRQIAKMVLGLAGPKTNVIHISSLAVFGFDLDQSVHAGMIPMRRDYEYVESKLYMEHLLYDQAGERELHVLRLGNVWGAGCPNWVIGLVRRLNDGLPVGTHGQDGFSNVTDVNNVASYIYFLLKQSYSPSVHFHHVSEFSHIRWSEWVDFLGQEIGKSPSRIDGVPGRINGLKPELREVLGSLGLNKASRAILDGRTSGSIVRQVLAWLPARGITKIKAARGTVPLQVLPKFDLDETNFYRIMACPTQFRPVMHADWRPELNGEMSRAQVKTWMRHAGFVEL